MPFVVGSGLIEKAFVLLSTETEMKFSNSLSSRSTGDLHGGHGSNVKTKQGATNDGHRGDDIDVGNLVPHDDECQMRIRGRQGKSEAERVTWTIYSTKRKGNQTSKSAGARKIVYHVYPGYYNPQVYPQKKH